MERREFLIQVGKSMAAVPLVLIATSCGDDDPAAPAEDNTRFTVSGSNEGHTHRITFQCAGLVGGTLVYDSTTDGGHHHRLELTDSEVTQILAGATVGPITSGFPEPTSTDTHTHTWTITKPPSACA